MADQSLFNAEKATPADDARIAKVYVPLARAALAVFARWLRGPSAELGQVIYAAWDKFPDPVMGPEEAIAILRALADAIEREKND